jgi:methyl-accepting chemotaxis protein
MFTFSTKKQLKETVHELEKKKAEIESAVSYIDHLQKGQFENEALLGKKLGFEDLQNSILTNKLVQFKDHLAQVSRVETERNWMNEGLAQFGILLRHSHSNLPDYYFAILSKLVKYLKGNQGKLYLYNKEENVLELVSSYAFERRKYLENTILPGEGLAGAVFLEKETTYLTDVPNDYIQITSGLGMANPRCVLIVPLKLNEEVYGIVELASFQELTSFQIEFVEKVGESIAASVSTRLVNEQTNALLEISRKQGLEMKEQEEQMRQNMEELAATQEEMKVKQSQLTASENQTRAILEASLDTIVSFDVKGTILTVNRTLEKMFGYLTEDVLGKNIHSLLKWRDENGKVVQNLEEITSSGNKLEAVRKDGTIFLAALLLNKTLLRGEEVFVGFISDITEKVEAEHHIQDLLQQSQQQTEELKAQEEELRQNMEEIMATQEELALQLSESNVLKRELEIRERVFGYTTILSESDAYGNITYANDKLCEVSKYSREELMGKPHNIFRHPEMPQELFKLFWDTIKQGNVFQGIIKNRAKDGTHYWVDATIVPVKNESGKIVKYIGARYHIKEDMLAERLFSKCIEDNKIPLGKEKIRELKQPSAAAKEALA